MTPYELGREAFLQGTFHNPPFYKYPESIQDWWEGYLDARTDSRLGDVFKRNEMTLISEDSTRRRSHGGP